MPILASAFHGDRNGSGRVDEWEGIMTKFWCAAWVVVLAGSALARAPGGPGDDEKSSDSQKQTKTLEALTAELQAQKAELDAQKAQIQQLQSGARSMSLEGTGVLPEPQDKAKSTLPEQVKSKWAMNLYGFVEADFIWDSTQGMSDAPGNPVLARPGTYAGEHSQLTFGVRNSRIGLNVAAPEYAGIRASARLEMDFLGTNGGGTLESNATWNNPTFRLRHGWLMLDSDYGYAQIGQGWELFGWQPYFHPNTVDIQGVPGQVYSRTPKFQLGHVFKGPVNIEAAVAASRPPERASGVPDVQGGLKFTFPDWVGVHTMGATGTAIDAAGFGISGLVRKFVIPRQPLVGVGNNPDSMSERCQAGVFDVFLPIMHPEKESRANSLSLTGEIAYGNGFNEVYSGFTGGAGAVAGIADAGYVGFRGNNLVGINWRTDNVGIQYYMPGDGTWWIAAMYSDCNSYNIWKMGATPAAGVPLGFGNGAAFKRSYFYNVDLFWDITPAVRIGVSWDLYRQFFPVAGNVAGSFSNISARDERLQFSFFFLF
jgi:hypothetical protein